MLKAAGRPDKSGPSMSDFKLFMKGLGYKNFEYPAQYYRVEKWYGTVYRRKCITFKHWLSRHLEGVYIVDMRGHVFTVVNGVIQDYPKVGPRIVIKRHWRIK